MLNTRRIPWVALWSFAWVVCLVLPATAADGDEPDAVRLLLKAQLQFQNMDYLSARKTLWGAYARREGLSDPQRQMLSDRLGEVDHAIQQQVIARALHKTAGQAAEEGDWQLARDAYAKVADCPYLPMQTRSQARAELAKVEMKLAEQLATRGPEPVDGKPMDVMAAPAPSGDEPAPARIPEPVETADLTVDDASADLSPSVEPVKPKPLSQEVASAQGDATFTDPEPIEAPAPEAPKETEPAANADQTAPMVKPDEPLARNETTAAVAEIEPVGAESVADAGQANPHDRPAGITPAPGEVAVGQNPDDGVPTGQQARNIKTEMLLAEGRAALNRNEPDQAVDYFSQAQKLAPDNPMILRELNNARMLTAQPAGAGILSDYRRQKRIARQIAEHDFTQAMDRSMELMADPDEKEAYDAAEQAAQVARNILQNNKRLFPTTEYRQKLAKVEDQTKWIREKREKYNRRQVARTVKEIEQANRQRQQRMQQRRQQKISDLTARVHVLRNEKKYQQALSVLEQIVDIDSDNRFAQDNIYWLKQHILLHQQEHFTDVGKTELAKLAADIRQAEIPWYQKIRYPRDWKVLSARRKRFGAGVAAESEENRRARDKLDRVIGKVRLADVKFADAISYLREVSGASIYVNWGALEVDNPDIRNQQVNVLLDDVSVETVLEKILAEAGGGMIQLGYVINKGVVNISTQEKLSIEVYPQVYDIRDLLTRIPNFISPRVDTESIGELEVGDGGGGGGGGGLFGDAEEDELVEEEMTKGQLTAKVMDMIKNTIERDSWYPNGNAQINELNGQLIITQTASNHRLVQQLVAKMREARTIQISIEARFITVQTGFLNQIGVDLDFYFNLGSQVGGGGRATDPFTGVTNVPVRGQSTWVQQGNSPASSLNDFSPITVGQDSSAFADLIGVGTNVNNGIGTSVTNSAMTIAGTFLDDLQVDFLLRATQAHATSRTLTAPRVTLFNGQRAYVTVSTQQAYISGAEAVVAEGATSFNPEISYVPTGTILDIDATVSHDRRYVTMTVRPQVVSADLSRSIIITGAGSGAGVAAIEINLPDLTMQDIQTTVSVPDGGTLLIGGQKLTGEIEREMGVPVISKLPVINRAFTNKGKLRDEETLLILIKPQIIIQDEVEEQPQLRTEEPAFTKDFAD